MKLDNNLWLRKYIFVILLVLFVIINGQIINATRDSKVTAVFNQWIIPGTDITILDDAFQVTDSEEDPNFLVLSKGDDHLVLRKDIPQRKFGYEFTMTNYRFNLDRLHEKSSGGTPLYGFFNNQTRTIHHSYRIQATLLRPILEFKRTINNKSVSHQSNNIYIDDINKRLHVVLEILNHGSDSVNVNHKEYLHDNFQILEVFSRNSKVSVETDYERDNMTYISITGNTKDAIIVKYTIIAKEDTEFLFDSEAETRYEGKVYYFNERNKTYLDISSGVDFRGGFHNNRDFAAKEVRVEIGEPRLYGVVIENKRNYNISDLKLKIEFPDNAQHITYNNERIFGNVFEKSVFIEANEKKEFPFNITIHRTGRYTIPAKLYYETSEFKTKFEIDVIINVNFFPLKPNVLFNVSDANRTSDFLIYLSNSNRISEVRNLRIIVESNMGHDSEEYEYYFKKINIQSTLLLNRLVRKITNPETDNVSVRGSFETIYGEVLYFNTSVSPIDGFRRDYNSRLKSIFSQNNLDERYEERIFQKSYSPFMETILLLTGMIVKEENQNSAYILPIFLFVFFASIQGIIILKRNKKNKSNKTISKTNQKKE